MISLSKSRSENLDKIRNLSTMTTPRSHVFILGWITHDVTLGWITHDRKIVFANLRETVRWLDMK